MPRPRIRAAHLPLLVLASVPLGAVLGATSAFARFPESYSYPVNRCVARKQEAAAGYCHLSLRAWGKWDVAQNGTARDARLAEGAARLQTDWARAERDSAADGVDCADTTLSAADAIAQIDAEVADTVADVNGGLDLGRGGEGQCGRRLLRAAAALCRRSLLAEARRIRNPARDPRGEKRDRSVDAVVDWAGRLWDRQQAAGCPTTGARLDATHPILTRLRADIVRDTTVSPNVDDAQFTSIRADGPIEYLGRQLEPTCLNDTPYRYFVKRGSENKLLVYYQGGGACWEPVTCSIPVCAATATSGDNPQNVTTGFADLSNPDNPFRNWNVVFVTYCSCDIHFGDAEQQYSPTLLVQHRGYHNARVVEKWAREHFVDPEVVFVTGSSAGAYGAWFHGPLLHEAWPGAQFHILGDAGNGVITQEFLDESFPNWNFRANLPRGIPGLREILDEGSGLVAYGELVANYFPNTNFAHYTTAFDGGLGGQTGFYNVMLNGNNPIAALSWWEGSCSFNQAMRAQAIETYARVPANYRYYIGSGSAHTIWGNDKLYWDTTGGVPPVVDWVGAMLASTPSSPNADWNNVECADCTLVLPGDPRPPVIPTPPFVQSGGNVVIDCAP